MTSKCFICGDERENSLEEHHIVPRRFGGSDRDENLVTLCASCHSAIEKIYDDSFYERLGVSKPTEGGIELSKIENVDEIADGDDIYIEKWNCFTRVVNSKMHSSHGLRFDLIGARAGMVLSELNTWPYDLEVSYTLLIDRHGDPIDTLGFYDAQINGNRVDLLRRFLEETES